MPDMVNHPPHYINREIANANANAKAKEAKNEHR